MKKKDNKKLYVSLFIIAIMVLSTFGFILGFNTSNSSQYDYNDFEFQLINNRWQTEVDGREYIFYSHPAELPMNIPGEISQAIIQNPTITLTFDPTISDLQYVDVARFELGQFLNDFGKNVQNAVTNQTTAYNLPVAACTSQPGNIFITFTQSNQSQASIQSNCITITAGTPIDFIRYTEKIRYMLLGVING